MPKGHFLDTNVLLYAASATTKDPAKVRLARELIGRGDFGTSGQVLAEFYWNATKARVAALSPMEAAAWVERLAAMPCAEVDANLVKAAIALSQRYRISYWDAAILAAAERLGAQVVYTEDMNHGQTYGSVRVENPFLDA